MNVWFVYVDYTDDGRPFYVGKGNESRVKEKERNSDWKVIAEQFGWRRETVYASRDENDAYAAEKWLVAYHDTFRGWGANLNEGGRGQKSGWKHTAEARAVMSAFQRGREHAPHSEATKQLLSERQRGKTPGNKGKPGRSPPNKGVPMSEEQKRRLSELNKGKPSNRRGVTLSDETRRKLSESHLGQVPHNKRFTDEIVDEMLKDRESGMMISDIAARYETSAPTVCRLFKARKEKNGEA